MVDKRNNDPTIDIKALKAKYNEARIQHRRLVREFKASESCKRDKNIEAKKKSKGWPNFKTKSWQ